MIHACKLVVGYLLFSHREFYDPVYYTFKILFIFLKLALISGHIIFLLYEKDGICYYNNDFAGVLKIHEIVSTCQYVFIGIHALDIIYQKMELSYEGQDKFIRYMKLLFGFSPLKFLAWYAGVYWVVNFSLAHDCIFPLNGKPSMNHYQYENSPQKWRGKWIQIEMLLGAAFVGCFVMSVVVYVMAEFVKACVELWKRWARLRKGKDKEGLQRENDGKDENDESSGVF